MKRLITILSLILFLSAGFQAGAQSITNYTFSASSGSFTALSGGTTMTLSSGSVDEGWFNGIPIGFTFVYMGVPYTTVSVSTNSWMTLGQNITSAAFTNALATGGNRPVIAPLWDDNEIQVNTNFSYQTTGSPGSMVFTAEWLNVQWNYNATGNTISHQLKLYEATGAVEFVYRDEGGSVNSGSASIGITAIGTGSGNYLSLNGTGTNPTVSSTTETTTLSTKPATGQTYTFTPPATTPAAPTALNFTNITGSSMTLNWTDNSSDETGFAILRSTDGINYTYIGSVAANVVTYEATGLSFGTTYYWNVHAVNEGKMSAPASGTQATNAPILTGIKTVPGDFATIAAAVNACNTQGIIPGGGGVTFNVAAGHTETSTTDIILTATGTAGDPIIFQKSGIGNNPLITRTDAGGPTSTTSLGAQGDAVIIIQGSDYVTFNQIDVTANDQGIEYGYYLRKASGTDGCKNVTIKNATITMNKGTSAYVVGIYSSNNDASSSYTSATGITVTSTGGRHENVTLTGNTIQNVFAGIVLRGFNHTSSPYDLYDQNFTVGANGMSNTIRNYAGNTASTSYGVYIIYHNYADVSYNVINNTAGGGTNFTSTAYGIFQSTATNSFGTFNNNEITLSSNTGQLRAIMFGTTSSGIGDYTCNGNIINLSMAGTSEATCIYATGTVNSFTINNNTFSYGTFASTTTSYLIYASTATNNVTINGNQTSGTINKTGAGTFYGYYNANTSVTGGTEAITNNVFSNITMASGSSALYGIYSSTATAQNRNCSNNTISNFTHGGTGLLYGITTLSTTNNQVSGNTVHTLNGGGTTYGLYFSGTNPSVYNNTVHSITTSGSTLAGIWNAGTGTTNCYKNQVFNLNSTNTSPTVSGILISAGTANYNYNNFISDIRATASNTDNSVRGINITSTTSSSTVGIYYNTIYLNATSSGTNFGSTGLFHTYNVTGTTASLDMRNNIIVNNSIKNGSGLTVAFRRSASTNLNNYGTTSNNNNFYAGTPSLSNLIFYDGLNALQSLTTFQAFVTPRETFSFSENTPFVNVAATPYDLHLQTSISTQCESGGVSVATPVPITDDYDGDIRFGETGYAGTGTAPDVGADEFDGIGQDLTPPAISYTLLGNGIVEATRPFSNVTIVDASGVNTTAGTAPRVYYKRSTDANAWNDNTSSTDGWKWKEANGTSSPFDFTIDYSLLNGGTGIITGDVIQYFVVAQDLAGTPNVGINTGTFAAAPASVALTAAAFPIGGTLNSYTIVASISGTKTVGSGGDYPSLTGAGGLFADINAKVVAGDITANVISNLTEDGANALNQWSESGTGNYTLTIKPNDASLKTISGSYAGGLIRLNGADRVIFDGDFASDAGNNYLAITNTATTGTIAAIQLISLGSGQGATNITIKNCNISCGHNNSGSYGIAIGGSSIATTGADNDNITIKDNNIFKAYVGIWAQGSGTSNPGLMDNLTILRNTIGSSVSTDYINHDGIIVANGTGGVISQNEIFNLIPGTTVTTPVGMTISTGFVNASISRNSIHNIKYTGTGGYGGRGLYVNTGNASSNLTIDNNLVYMIEGDGWSTFPGSSMVGMYFDGTTGGLKIYYNSVYMSGEFARSTATLTTAILFYTSTITNIDLRNNIFQNSMDNTSMTTDKNYAIYSVAPNTSFTFIDYNDYYVNGPQGVLGYLGGDKTTLADWKTATGKDVNSIDTDPQFVSINNLNVPSSSPVIGGGTPISGIDYDYIDADRDDANPSIGAYEEGLIITCPIPGNLTTTNITSTTADLNWTENGSATTWDVLWGPKDFDPNTGGTLIPGITSKPYTLNPPLTPDTPYDWYVRADCGGASRDVSDWSVKASFRTLCAAVSSFSENFDAVTPPALPSCWEKIGAEGSSYTQTSGNFSSPNCLYIFASSGTYGATVAMPLLSNLGAGTHKLTFKLRANFTVGGVVQVGYMTDRTDPSTFTLLQSFTTTSTTVYQDCEVIPGVTPGSNTTLAFRQPPTPGYSALIDNVVWEEIPSCPAPSGLTSTNITATTADLNWTENGPATQWDVIWGSPGFDPNNSGTLISGITSKPYTLNAPLTPATPYDWYVRADCGGASRDVSAWSAKASFTTLLCDPADQCNYTFNLYDSYGDGWNGATMQVIQNSVVIATIGTGFTSGPTFVETVALCDGINFSVFWNNGGSWPAECGLEIIDAFSNQIYYQVPVGSGNVGTTLYSGMVNCTPLTCPPPSVLTATNITPASADLGWTPGGTEIMWNVEVGPPGFTPGTGSAVLSEYYTTDNLWTATPLVEATDYEFYVQAYCNNFVNPKKDNFWMAISDPGVLIPDFSGGTDNDPGETGEWYEYYDPEAGLPWWNIWFYNDPLDTTRMKKVRMGFWVWAYDNINPGELFYVINWSDSTWDGLGFPTPEDEAYILRSPLNGPVIVPPGGPMWIELYYIIEDFNPEWISVDIWGENILIEEASMAPPMGSPLLEWWDPSMLGGIIVHECLPKDHNVSTWSGPQAFKTPCVTIIPPFTEDFELALFPPDCWDNQAVSGTYLWTRSTAASGYGTGTSSAFANFYLQSSGSYELISPVFDISSLTNPMLAFDHAYATYSGEVDQMDVYYSTDGGTNWTLLLAMPGGTSGILNTGGTITSSFVPGPSQWNSQYLSLPTGTNMVKFRAVSAFGNNLYLDNVKVISPYDHDVSALSIDINPVVPLGTLVGPKATVKNEGINPETFTVTLASGAYSSTKTVTALASFTTLQVTFDDWVNSLGIHTFTLTTSLTGDQDVSNDVNTKAVKVMELNKQVYAYNAFPGGGTDPEGPTSFNLSSPGTLNSIADQTADNFIASGTWANGLWYGTVHNTTTPYNLITIDPTTGVRTTIGDMGVGMTGISYNLADGVMYGVGYTDPTTTLYTINLATGLASPVGSTASGILLINLAINAAGQAYALDLISDNIGMVNLATGAFSSVGPAGFDANFAQDMEFDRETGELYLAAYGANGWLGWVDKSTGQALKIGDFEGGAEITGMAIPYITGTNQWTGLISTDWNNSGNWGSGHVPYQTEQVVIPSAPIGSRFPNVPVGVNASCFDVTLQPGAVLTVDQGATLYIVKP